MIVPSKKLATKVGNVRLDNMLIRAVRVQEIVVIAQESLKKRLYPALDLRCHKMVSINTKALEWGARFVKGDSSRRRTI